MWASSHHMTYTGFYNLALILMRRLLSLLIIASSLAGVFIYLKASSDGTVPQTWLNVPWGDGGGSLASFLEASSKITSGFLRFLTTMTATASTYSTRQSGAKHSLTYRCFLQNSLGKIISPFHDVPLFHDEAKGVLNMVVEVPRFSNAKLEISKDELMNPIKQDVKKGALRYVKNCFPYHGYIWNYGAFPQTWESPKVIDHNTGFKGDNDPIDVIEIGSAIATTGQVKQVKVLGALAMLDEGETDWKIIAIDINDPLASKLEDADDLERVCPGLLDATRTWFTVYKIPDGKPANGFAFDGAVKGRTFALQVIKEVHEMWCQLVSGKVPSKTDDYEISIVNRQVKEGPKIHDSDLQLEGPLPDAPHPESTNGWSYVPPQH